MRTIPLALAALLLPAEALAVGEVRSEGGRFVDASGAVLVLRGVNVAGDAKVPPFRPASDPAIFEPLPGFGFDTVRLLFTWEAYEPSPGAYDASYLAYYVDAVRAATSRGLWVVVDFHQDGFSRHALDGCGDGAPPWAIDPAIPLDTPDNGPACASWGAKLVQDADTHAAFASFFADVGGARTAYLAMVRTVAEALADEPGVIGYDLMNEPWSDAEATELPPFHADGATTIRDVSPEALIFVSPRAFTSSGAQTLLPPPAFGNAAYAPHFYDAGVLLFGSWLGDEPDEPFAVMTEKAAEWGVPLFLGELGAPATATGAKEYSDMLYRRLDAGFHGSAHWVYTPGWTPEAKDGWNVEDLSIVDDTGALRDNFRVSPHPRRIAGTPVSFVATHEPPTLELAWEHDPSLGQTLAFLPVDAWLGGVPQVSAEGATCIVADDTLQCQSSTAGPAKVTVRRALPTPPASSGCSIAAGGATPASPGCALFVCLSSVAGLASLRRLSRGSSRGGASRARGRRA